jgi:HK97 family phage portal protein
MTLDDLIRAYGSEVGESASMKLSTVFACVRVLSDSMSKLPVYGTDIKTHAEKELPVLRLLNTRPNPYMAPAVFKKLMEARRLLEGNAYAWIDRRGGRPFQLVPLPGGICHPEFNAAGYLIYRVSMPETTAAAGRLYELSAADVIHLKGYSADGLIGVSVLTHAASEISNARSAQRYQGGFYNRNGRPSGVLTSDSQVSLDASDKIRTEWERVHNGPDNAFRIAVLGLGFKYSPIGIAQRDAQFIETQELSVVDISRFFGVPLYKLNAGKMSYNSNEQSAIEYVVSTLHPIAQQAEEEYSYKLLSQAELDRHIRLKVDLDAELRGDAESRSKWYTAMHEIGAFSPNDIRAQEDWPATEGGDVHTIRLDRVPLHLVDEAVKGRIGQKGGEDRNGV